MEATLWVFILFVLFIAFIGPPKLEFKNEMKNTKIKTKEYLSKNVVVYRYYDGHISIFLLDKNKRKIKNSKIWFADESEYLSYIDQVIRFDWENADQYISFDDFKAQYPNQRLIDEIIEDLKYKHHIC